MSYIILTTSAGNPLLVGSEDVAIYWRVLLSAQALSPVYGADDYKWLLRSLLPVGSAWPKDDGAILFSQIEALSLELKRISDRSIEILREVLPTSCAELLSDWERVTGLASQSSPALGGSDQRRAALIASLRRVGRQDRSFYIGLAADLGYSITITEYRPFRAGVSRCSNSLGDEDWAHAWKASAPPNTVREFKVGANSVGDSLRTWGNGLLESIFNDKYNSNSIIS